MKRRLHSRFRKASLPPGTLIRRGEAKEFAKPTITVVDYLEDAVEEREVDTIDEILPSREKRSPTWIDISGDHSIPTIQRLGEIFDLHALTLEDILNVDQRPKVETFDDKMYLVLHKPVYRYDEERVQIEQVSIIITPYNVISLHERVPPAFSPIRSRMHQEKRRIRNLGTDYLAYVIVDAIVDEYYVVMEQCEDRLQELERDISTQPKPETIEHLHRLRQEVIQIRRSVWPLRDVIATLSKTESPLFDKGIKVYLKDLQDHIFQIIELVEVYRDMVAGMLDVYLSTMSFQMNQVMKTLTMIASIFIPLTLITGIYGMNFVDMPELHWAFGYPMALGIMVLVALGMIWFFRRRRWI